MPDVALPSGLFYNLTVRPQNHPFQASLLDLPDLTLEEIAKHLPVKDLASCMLCCTTLRSLLLPRLSAMVRARSMGKKWALNACGRALFADIGGRVAAGVAAYEDAESVSNWAIWTAALRGLTGDVPALFKTWVGMKATSLSTTTSDRSLDLSIFLYLFLLAESLGFKIITEMMKVVWGLASEGSAMALGPANWDTIFRELKTCQEGFGLNFHPFVAFTGNWSFPEPDLELPVGPSIDFFKLQCELYKACYAILPTEIMCPLLLVFFFKYINSQNFASHHQLTLENMSRGTPNVGDSWVTFFRPPANR